MLIKDPYLDSCRKDIDIRSQPTPLHPNATYMSHPLQSEAHRGRSISGG